MTSTHQSFDMPVLNLSNSGSTVFLESDKSLVLNDAVMNSRLDAVRQLITGGTMRSKYEVISIIVLAAWHSTPELLLWLLDYFTQRHTPFGFITEDEIEVEALQGAIEGENLPNIKLLLSRGADIMKGVSDRIILQLLPEWEPGGPAHGLLRALRRWNGDLMKFLVEDCGVVPPPIWLGNISPAYIFGARHLTGAGLEDVRRRFASIKPYLLWPEVYTLGPDFAIDVGTPSVVKVCLENGGDPNMVVSGFRPLFQHVARAGRDGLEITELLLEYGADPNAQEDRWKTGYCTALYEAVKGRGDCVQHAKLLLQHGANPNLGGSSLYAAVQKGRAEMTKLLLQHGADPWPQKKKEISRLAGMKKIEAYFGAPWEDIVRRIQAGEDLEGEQRRKRV
jgi:hypothetical protein